MDKKLLIILLVYCLIQIPIILSFNNLTADENVYYVMGREISEGKTPYIDFFYVHPPLQVYLYAAVILLFGFKVWLLKLFTLCFVVGINIFLYLIVKEKYDERTAIVSVLLFLTSYDIFLLGSFGFGVEIAVFFFMWALYLNDKKPFMAGLLFGIGLVTRLHVAPLGIVLWLHSKDRWQFLWGTFIVPVHYLSMLLVPNFGYDVLFYHTAKARHWVGWGSFAASTAPLLMLAMLSMSYLWRKIRHSVFLDIIIAFFAFLLIIGSVYEYYFLIITIMASILGSHILLHHKLRKVFLAMYIIWVVVSTAKVGMSIYNQNIEYGVLVDYIGGLDNNNVMGEPTLAALITMRYPDKKINKLQIDIDKHHTYTKDDFEGSIVVFNKPRFNGYRYGCSILLEKVIYKWDYVVWGC